ncbi:carbohydrate ABC transporter permease [Pseudokineococcus marinus]|uniref:Carbohydrate ABC transporter permease n=1 Tax=Pseudokineococcus marinus TaxID=351215 RepID=A0A849BL59_9ACTN|nr:carbohydrate ABC transporter permease [Pseudokineococcus marinus]NNH24009.1 carbohydrate ABC transporter permease [Pseudokineococcus marinus]
MTTSAPPASVATAPAQPPARRPRRTGRSPWFHVVMVPFTVLWLLPLAFIVVLAFRSFDDVASRGIGALPASFTLDAFTEAVTRGDLGRALLNSGIVTVITVVLSLVLASWAAFALARFRIPFRRTVLLVMLAGNLLPPQILLVPVSRITQSLGLYDSLAALVVVQVGFGLGFYTFVLHGFVRNLPQEVFEAALIDGAGTLRTYRSIVLPLTRPALAALAALATTWVFNDLIWAMTVLRTETRFPITAALLNLQGGYSTSWNVLAAGCLLAALPTALVFFAFQKHFVSGLLVGSDK